MANTTESSLEILKTPTHVVNAATVAGAAYVKKITHPPSMIPTDYAGTPDNSDANVVTIEVKAESNFPPILTLGITATTTATTNPSSMMFVQTSGLYGSTYVFLLDPNGRWVQPINQVGTVTQPTVTQVCHPAVTTSGYNFNQFTSDVSSFRAVYGSNTYYLNATDFNNQGTVTTAKFRPSLSTATSESFRVMVNTMTPTEAASFLRAINISVRAMLNGKPSKQILTGDDYMYELREFKDVKDIPPSLFLIQYWNAPPDSVAAALPFNTNMSELVNVMPTDASGVLVMSSKGATRPAKDGAFVVQQQIGPVSGWTDVTTTVGAQPVFPTGLPISLIRCNTGIVGGSTFATLFSHQNTGNSGTPYSGETPWNNLDWTFTLFEGLTVPSTVGTTLTSVPYITVKSFKGFEASPYPFSSLLPFQHLLPMPDPAAIQMAVGIMHARPDSLPASANDLASIAATAVKFIPTAVSWLKDLFGSPKKKSEAMDKANKFVGVKKEDKKIESKENGLSRQVANLTKLVSSMSASRNTTTLPSYNNAKASENLAGTYRTPRKASSSAQRKPRPSAPPMPQRTSRPSRSRARK